MNLEDTLRDRLESVATPPSRVDLDTLVTAGRRRAFRRRATEAAGGVVLVSAVLLAVPWVLNAARPHPAAPLTAAGGTGASRSPDAPASAEPSPSEAAGAVTAPTSPVSRRGDCRMEELRVPAGVQDVSAAAVDPTGRYIVGNGLDGQDFRAVLWADGEPRALPLSGQSMQATDVNAGGTVVGLVSEGARNHVFRYERGELVRLRTPEGSWRVYPEPAVNAAGDVVINARPYEGGEGLVLLWKAGDTVPTRLPLPAEANVQDIGDDGTLVGAVYEDGQVRAAYVWDRDGVGRELERPGGATAAAYAIAGDQVTGGVWHGGGDPRTAVWSARTGAVSFPELAGPGAAINGEGVVLNLDGAAARGGAPLRLGAPAGQVAVARGVSDTGLVVGQAVRQGEDGVGTNLGPRMWRC